MCGRKGLWLVTMLALWPDGSAAQDVVVFVSDRDGDREIYSMGSTGQHQTNLTQDSGRDQAPAVSPDGRTVAWMSDRSGQFGVWLMAIDGSMPRLLREVAEADFGLSWAPEGDRLALTLQSEGGGTHDLALLEIDNGELVRLTDTPTVEEVTPTWSPRGDTLYYIAGSGDATVLMRLDLTSGSNETIVGGLPAASYPTVSPNGATVLLRSRTDQFDVLRVDVKVGRVDNLTRHPANDWGAVWSPDGQSIIFASDRDGDMEIYSMDLSTGALTQLTANSARDWMPSR